MLKKSFFIAAGPSFPESWEKVLYFPSGRGARDLEFGKMGVSRCRCGF
jgi:hypothetical protein